MSIMNVEKMTKNFCSGSPVDVFKVDKEIELMSVGCVFARWETPDRPQDMPG